HLAARYPGQLVLAPAHGLGAVVLQEHAARGAVAVQRDQPRVLALAQRPVGGARAVGRAEGPGGALEHRRRGHDAGADDGRRAPRRAPGARARIASAVITRERSTSWMNRAT